ncbi:hypothetical protein LZ575_02365 [Antarcticibacterium sp. 1MA-6-2]|uniref:hypothetical protein n=1 Tax=Antarcticibacterium sp. 1MA-6-2 TaxID=2908210 RepID=UPI001F25AC42|nr:hypothetical protein [Antarcticibacterium sp. 1MA-6-2]UJH91584.1 hypothetical protein LZ575_02365 [Antarcticibacterium sp. 1MA-6-2]
MKKFLAFGCICLFPAIFFSQEIPSSTSKPVFERSIPASSGLPSILLREAPKEDYKLKDDPTKPKPLEMMNKQELLTAGDFIEKKWAEDEKAKSEYGEGQNLGNFVTKGKFVEIYCRDYQYVDGDRVRVIVNGKVVNSDITLGAGYTPILVVLKDGFNTVEIEALNQGSSGPNTAAFTVFDETGKQITSNYWNLLSGAKASMIVVKN